METSLIIFVVFVGLFTFAFTFAWILPLITAHTQQKKEYSTTDLTFSLFDYLLMLFDCFPLLWLIRSAPISHTARAAVIHTWKKEASIRTAFYASTIGYSILFICTCVAYFTT